MACTSCRVHNTPGHRRQHRTYCRFPPNQTTPTPHVSTHTHTHDHHTPLCSHAPAASHGVRAAGRRTARGAPCGCHTASSHWLHSSRKGQEQKGGKRGKAREQQCIRAPPLHAGWVQLNLTGANRVCIASMTAEPRASFKEAESQALSLASKRRWLRLSVAAHVVAAAAAPASPSTAARGRPCPVRQTRTACWPGHCLSAGFDAGAARHPCSNGTAQKQGGLVNSFWTTRTACGRPQLPRRWTRSGCLCTCTVSVATPEGRTCKGDATSTLECGVKLHAS